MEANVNHVQINQIVKYVQHHPIYVWNVVLVIILVELNAHHVQE